MPPDGIVVVELRCKMPSERRLNAARPDDGISGVIERRCAGYSGCEIVLAPTSSCNLAGISCEWKISFWVICDGGLAIFAMFNYPVRVENRETVRS